MKNTAIAPLSFEEKLESLGVDPDDVIEYLRAELVSLAREKKEAGLSYQDFQNMIFESGFECTYYLS